MLTLFRERGYLFCGERTISAFGEIAELKWADRDADEAQDLNVERFEHAPDLAVFSFVENN